MFNILKLYSENITGKRKLASAMAVRQFTNYTQLTVTNVYIKFRTLIGLSHCPNV